ncbi:hypothetical protein CHU98_g11143 [Xylaria longipes]|nr:hypothetical protein CHU98_g11143 [Xylaria longipes]
MALSLVAPTGHDCRIHHLRMPSPEITIPDRQRQALALYTPNKYRLIPNSYDADELANAINAITDNLRQPSSKELSYMYNFIADYLSEPSPAEMSLQELHAFFDNLMVQIDIYFFQGALTQGPEPYLRLIVLDRSMLEFNAFYQHLGRTAGRIVLYLRNSSTGKRRLKVSLLSELVHELVHAYLRRLFNFCPARDESYLVTDYEGHGRLWQQILGNVYSHIRKFHPSLRTVGLNVEEHANNTFISCYYGLAARIPWIRQEWEVTNLRWYEPDIFRYWWWQPTRKEEFKRALLRLLYNDYTHFVSTKVPYPWIPYRLCCFIVAVMIVYGLKAIFF